MSGPIMRIYDDLTYWKKSTYLQMGKVSSILTRNTNVNTSGKTFFNVTTDSRGSDESLIYISDASDVEMINDDSDTGSIVAMEVVHVKSKKPKNNEKLLLLASEVIRKRNLKKKSKFILDEAEDAFDDEECFIDDEATQAAANKSLEDFIVDDEEDDSQIASFNHKNYLKSISDMVGRPHHNKYKLKYDFDSNINVYSQAVMQDDDYEMDSFCDDEIIYEGSTSSKFKSPELKSRSKKYTKNKTVTSTPKENAKPKQKRYKRIVVGSP